MAKYYFNMNYTADQAGLDIRREDVVRPDNHRFITKDEYEDESWYLRSRPGIPTYGNCTNCYKSGPVGKGCNECGNAPNLEDGYVYKIARDTDGVQVVYDAMAVAAIFGRGHETAKADRMYSLGHDSVLDASIDHVRVTRFDSFMEFWVDHVWSAAPRLFAHVEDPKMRADLILQAKRDFRELHHEAYGYSSFRPLFPCI